jgi:hypothetical protein
MTLSGAFGTVSHRGIPILDGDPALRYAAAMANERRGEPLPTATQPCGRSR